MDVTVSPSSLQGSVAAVASKSDAHRKLVAAALSTTPTSLIMTGSCEDIEATMRCLTALGASFDVREKSVVVTPITEAPEEAWLDCGESGATFRFMLPVAAALGVHTHFTGEGRLPERPISDLVEVMSDNGVLFSSATLPFSIAGRLEAGRYPLRGDVSSQYITGLMLALPVVDGESSIDLLSPLKSSAYVDMTLAVLDEFGVDQSGFEGGWTIRGSQRFVSPGSVLVDGDWSSAAFPLAAGALHGSVSVTGLDIESIQGDRRVMEVLASFGAIVSSHADEASVVADSLGGGVFDVDEIPDLLPILAVVASCARGTTRFTGAERLRHKESDRLTATADLLTRLGIEVEERADELVVYGGELTGGTVDGYNDHRIVMAAAIAGTRASGPVTISDAEAIRKSYPTFFKDLVALGGEVSGL